MLNMAMKKIEEVKASFPELFHEHKVNVMSNICPVCRIEFTNAKCGKCGFEMLAFAFLSDDDANEWYKNIVEPLGKAWKDSRKTNCKNCGKEMQEDWKLCPYCGTSAAPTQPLEETEKRFYPQYLPTPTEAPVSSVGLNSSASSSGSGSERYRASSTKPEPKKTGDWYEVLGLIILMAFVGGLVYFVMEILGW